MTLVYELECFPLQYSLHIGIIMISPGVLLHGDSRIAIHVASSQINEVGECVLELQRRSTS